MRITIIEALTFGPAPPTPVARVTVAPVKLTRASVLFAGASTMAKPHVMERTAEPAAPGEVPKIVPATLVSFKNNANCASAVPIMVNHTA